MKLPTTVPIMIFTLMLSTVSSLSAGEGDNEEYLPKLNARFMVEQRIIPQRNIRMPFKITAKQGEWLCVGNAWINKDDVIPAKAAVDYYTELLKKHPQNSWLYNVRGFAWQSEKEYDKAIQDYDKAIQLNPEYAHAYFGRGRARKQKKEYFQSIQDHSKALELVPGYVQALNGRGIAWRNTQRFENAIRDYSTAIENEPRYIHAHNNRGSVYGEIGEYQKAIKDLKDTLAIDSKHSLAHNNLAWIFATASTPEFRDAERALAHGTQACELTSWKNESFIDSLAAAYAEQGDFQQAVKYEKMALALFPEGEIPPEYKSRLKLYQAGKPYHEVKAPTIPDAK